VTTYKRERDAGDENDPRTWMKRRTPVADDLDWIACWYTSPLYLHRDQLPARLTLLVRGGKVWPS